MGRGKLHIGEEFLLQRLELNDACIGIDDVRLIDDISGRRTLILTIYGDAVPDGDIDAIFERVPETLKVRFEKR